MNIIINTESFLKDPNKYFAEAITSKNTITVSTAHGDAVLLSADKYAKYEEYEILDIIRQRKADIAAGHFVTLEEFEKAMDDKIAEWKNK
ncbi:MAG: hypothetical protein FWH03_06510 [Firmicutes bacterium]|nr:hypothetical protein [Bacillota bacterium]